MKKILPLVLLACVAAAPASALDLIGQDPVFDTFVIKVEEPVTLIFDASLNGATVTTDNVFLTRVDNASVVAASLSLASTNQADDTVVIDPTADLRFGVRYRLTIETALEDAGANAFSGAYPFGRDFVPNVPRDLHFPNCAPDDTACLTDLTNHLMGFNPIDPGGHGPVEDLHHPRHERDGGVEVGDGPAGRAGGRDRRRHDGLRRGGPARPAFFSTRASCRNPRSAPRRAAITTATATGGFRRPTTPRTIACSRMPGPIRSTSAICSPRFRTAWTTTGTDCRTIFPVGTFSAT
ncbi:MAG: Ig-like domain-containing protein [Deltaproteobacteria bacterium]|nr:Ig-like domain-containing protein [Deltaproteobacteria bacterium]